MALGLSAPHSLAKVYEDFYAAFSRNTLCTCRQNLVSEIDYVWDGQELVDRICEVKGITREKFIRTMAAPKPTYIQHLIFLDELRTAYGSTANLPDKWPSGQGVIVPKKEAGEIVGIEFYRMSQMLKPRLKQAA